MTRRDILTAIPTAFAADGSLDADGTRAIFQYVAQSGNEGAFVLGTTGEFPSINEDEFRTVVELALAELSPVTSVVVHVGAPSAYQAVRLVNIAREAGATRYAALTPYYMASSDDAIFAYFEQVAAAVGDGDLFVYNYPKRSGNHVSPELMARLATIPAVVGAKVSELTLDDIRAYRAATPADFIIYTGADRDLIAAGEAGAQGVVSGVSSVVPKPFRALIAAAESGDAEQIAAAQADVDDVVATIGGDMPRMKAAYRAMGITDSTCRMALDEPTDAALAQIDRIVATYV
ncbi:4-hydroxy-tetrahydrodipicolinate synthase [Microbacterium mitrae]|uniref:Dihydrodipicolinate synthase family protein n=1 Tax=Microbacterium mitrae TaxID=664640 RepID=A0A5C8HL78_9MICO|nr:dihydrodipicolinate synthase family protein [Microbacterium mitrae]TXK04046.1 dihydrodipicolinate synthase family protein [Microbacterium mitrae]